jgi:hypothetical protein
MSSPQRIVLNLGGYVISSTLVLPRLTSSPHLVINRFADERTVVVDVEIAGRGDDPVSVIVRIDRTIGRCGADGTFDFSWAVKTIVIRSTGHNSVYILAVDDTTQIIVKLGRSNLSLKVDSGCEGPAGQAA